MTTSCHDKLKLLLFITLRISADVDLLTGTKHIENDDF